MTGYEKNFVDDFHHIEDMFKELSEIVDSWDTTEIKPNCAKDLLEQELDALYNLLKIMELRADTAGIKL